MTTKRTNTKSTGQTTEAKSAYASQWRGFVNLDLRPADKDKAIQLTTDLLAFWAAVEGCCLGGYRLSVNYSQKENIYTATATGNLDHDTDSGIAVSARSSSPDRAIAAVMIKLESAQWNLSNLFEGSAFRPVDV